jgi:hypothetical protein
VAAVEGQQHLNSSNNTALGSEVQVSRAFLIVFCCGIG